jgi:hypothetical protein
MMLAKVEDKVINLGGRPPLFEDPKVLEDQIEAYFNDPDHEYQEVGDTIWQKKPITITGLALWLGFESRQSFYDYEKHDKFSYIIKKARLRVEQEYEAKLSRNNPTGSIFALKNMGWKDTSEIKHQIERSFLTLDPLTDDSSNPSITENSQP